MSDKRRLYRTGLLTLLVLALVAVLVGAAAGLRLGSREYTAVLEHTAGLRAGEEVQVAGVGVGEVTSVELGRREVRVGFTVDDDVRLGSRTTAEVKVATLLGTHFLMVRPEGSGELAGDTIPLARTRVPYNLQDVLDRLSPEVDQFDTKTIEESMATVAEVLDASGEEVGPALAGVRDVSALMAARSDQIAQLLRAARQVSRQLRASAPDLLQLMRQADLILDTLRARRQVIRALLRDLTTLGDQLSGVVEDIRGDVAPTLRDLDRVTALLRRSDARLSEGIRTLAPTVRYFANAGGTGRWLDLDMPTGVPDTINCGLEGRC